MNETDIIERVASIVNAEKNSEDKVAKSDSEDAETIDAEKESPINE